MKRVVVTGIGVITPIGVGKEAFYRSLKRGVSGVGPISRFDTSPFSVKVAAEVKDWPPGDYRESDFLSRDRFIQFSLVASDQAIRDARIKINGSSRKRMGVLISSSKGGMETFERVNRVFIEKGPSEIPPAFLSNFLSSSASSLVAERLKAGGPVSNVVSACATGTHSIMRAAEMIREEETPVMLAGSSEASLTPLILAGFSSMGALSKRNEKTPSPFDKERDGFVIGEGAGVVVLESLEHALIRRAHIYGEIAGYAWGADAHHMTSFDPGGDSIARAIEEALNKAGLFSSELSYINAHGTATQQNDRVETVALKKALGRDVYSIPISSTKSMTGHLLGAAGSVEFIACLLALEKNFIPPTINYEHPDPDCDLDYVPNRAREREIENAISLSFGFGGHIGALIVKKMKGL